jgi:hypothetical protein
MQFLKISKRASKASKFRLKIVIFIFKSSNAYLKVESNKK